MQLDASGSSSTIAGLDRYSGSHVRVAVIDDGFNYHLSELSLTYDRLTDRDWRDGDDDAAATAGEWHGTAVMSVLAAAADGSGMTGTAPGATVAGLRIGYGSAGSPAQYAAAIADAARFDIANLSWGYDKPFADNFRSASYAPIGAALEKGAATGRGGLGTVYVVAAGNGRLSGDDVNHHNLANAPTTIAVGAVDANGRAAAFSTPGAAVLVSALGVDVDILGVKGGLTQKSGTSFAAPVVSGVVARMLEANADLGWRDVQEILAYTAVAEPEAAGWRTNAASGANGGGLLTSRDVGFGVVDAVAAVRLAESWSKVQTTKNLAVAAAAATPFAAIPDLGSVASAVKVDAALKVEQVEVTVDILHSWRGDLRLTLVSPQGTESVLLDRPGRAPDAAAGRGQAADDVRFRLSSNEFWGEAGAGNWTLRIEDAAAGDTGRLIAWSLKVMGGEASADDVFIFTDAFAELGAAAERRALSDAGGEDEINCAALSTSVFIDLDGVARIAGHDVAIAGARIENAVGGEGSDVLWGSTEANALSGGRGDDRLFGRGGDDVLRGGEGSDRLDGGAGFDVALFEHAYDRYVFARDGDFGFVTLLDEARRATLETDRLQNIEELWFSDRRMGWVDAFPAAPRGFAPDAIAGLNLWLDASQAEPGLTARLADLSGLGSDAVQKTAAAQAVAIADGGLRFDGGDSYWIADRDGLNLGGPFTGKTWVFAVALGSDVSSRQVLFEQGGSARGVSFYVEDGMATMAAWNFAEKQWGPASAALPVSAGEVAIITATFDAAAQQLMLAVNGATAVAGKVGVLYAHGDDIGLGGVRGSALDATGAEFSARERWEGEIFEVAAYDRALTEVERHQLAEELGHKWGGDDLFS